MTEIKRYEMNYKGLPELDAKGVWVLNEDHCADTTAKDARIAALQEQVRALAADSSSLKKYIDDECYIKERGSGFFAEADICATEGMPETPTSDAFIHEIRSQARIEGIHFAANRLLAAWESGFVNGTPAAAHDISGAILSAVEFLPNADEGEFKRDYADEVRARIKEGEQP